MEAIALLLERCFWILETIARQHTNHRGTTGHLIGQFQETRHRSRTSRLTEDTFLRSQQTIGIQDFLIGDGIKGTLAGFFDGDRPLPVGRIANANGRRNRFGMGDNLALDKGADPAA